MNHVYFKNFYTNSSSTFICEFCFRRNQRKSCFKSH
ncbi:hypothetical protein [Reichenbachiella versicolor]